MMQIACSVLPSVAEAQLLPAPNSLLEWRFTCVDIFITAAFTLELMLNMAATLVLEFIVSGWNWYVGGHLP